jgi:hypothetical protein
MGSWADAQKASVYSRRQIENNPRLVTLGSNSAVIRVNEKDQNSILQSSGREIGDGALQRIGMGQAQGRPVSDPVSDFPGIFTPMKMDDGAPSELRSQ